MGRAKPFVKSLNNLVAAGVVPKPVWLDIVDATRPPFLPIASKRVRELVYPEDRLRSVFLLRNPETRRIPVNLHAESIADRHISDRFVSLQTKLIQEQGLSEDKAYDETSRILSEYKREMEEQSEEQDIAGPLSNPSIKDEASRAFMASYMDSRRDQKIHQALTKLRDYDMQESKAKAGS